ncbi:MAG: alpha-1,2-fucosyltransferase, partial [Patescibacteria group bacterium]
MKIICIGGGLGNQMFQYAFRLNALNNQDVYLDITRVRYLNEHNGFELSRIFNISEKVITKFLKFRITGPYIYIRDRDVNFYRILFFLNKKISKFNLNYIGNYLDDNRVLLEYNFNDSYLHLLNKKGKPRYFYGTFQSYKYFEDIKEEVKKVFTFPKIEKVDEKNFETQIEINVSESVSIHVRRGDYLKPQWDYLNICDYDYYKNAFNFIKDKLKN